MALLANEVAVILTKEDCIALVNHLGIIDRQKLKRLQMAGVLDIYEKLRQATKEEGE